MHQQIAENLDLRLAAVVRPVDDPEFVFDQGQPLFEGEQRVLADIFRHGDDQAIADPQGAPDDIDMPVRDRVEGARINCDTLGHGCAPPSRCGWRNA